VRSFRSLSSLVSIPRRGLLAAVAVGVVGCRSAHDAQAKAPLREAREQVLVADENGRVRDTATGTTGIRGRWFAATDADDCQKKGKHAPEACSFLVTPDPTASSFLPTGDLGFCAVGVAAKPVPRPDGTPDWENIWGARIGLTLNDGKPYDARAHGVTGFAFHIDSEPPPNRGMRVQLAMGAGNDPPVWGGATTETSPVHLGRNEMRWADVAGPPYLENPPTLDPGRLVSIQFTIPTHPADSRSFSFCISHLAALTD
jgi:hypothetical protein